jgi:hypothetical protein
LSSHGAGACSKFSTVGAKKASTENPRNERFGCSINVTLDGCYDHRVIVADEALHHHAVANLERADALLFGRVTLRAPKAPTAEDLRSSAVKSRSGRDAKSRA